MEDVLVVRNLAPHDQQVRARRDHRAGRGRRADARAVPEHDLERAAEVDVQRQRGVGFRASCAVPEPWAPSAPAGTRRATSAAATRRRGGVTFSSFGTPRGYTAPARLCSTREAAAVSSPSPVPRSLCCCATAAGAATPPRVERLAGLDTRLCPFPLRVIVSTTVRRADVRGRAVTVRGPTTVTLRNAATGRTAVLRAAGKSARDPVAGDLRFVDRQLWLGGARHVPYLSTDGDGAVLASTLVADRRRGRGASSTRARSSPASRRAVVPRATPAPWGVPAVRADAHGRRRPEPADRQADPSRPPAPRRDREREAGDDPGRHRPGRAGRPRARARARRRPTRARSATARPATTSRPRSPLRSCRRTPRAGSSTCRPSGRATLDARPVLRRMGRALRRDAASARYCAGGGKELRVYVDGKRRRGDPRRLVLRDGQEIAVVFGGRAAFRIGAVALREAHARGLRRPGRADVLPGLGRSAPKWDHVSGSVGLRCAAACPTRTA